MFRNLKWGVFNGGGGHGGTFTEAGSPTETVIFASPYLDFALSLSESFSFSLSGATSAWSVDANGRVLTNAANVTGTFVVDMPGLSTTIA